MRRTVDHNRANIRPATADTTQVSIALQMVLQLERVEYRPRGTTIGGSSTCCIHTTSGELNFIAGDNAFFLPPGDRVADILEWSGDALGIRNYEQ
jgi:hypothetical protein